MHLPSSLLPLLLVPVASAAAASRKINIKPASLAAMDAADPTAGCSATSFHSFGWVAKDFDFHASYIFTTPAHQNSWGYVSFDLVNPADESTVHCEAASSQLNDFFYGNVQYRCNDTERVGKTSFDFNRPANYLRVNQTWTCDDQKSPIIFTGRGEANLTLDCTETNYQNRNWTIGEIYSSREIKCAPTEFRVQPVELSAIA